MSYYVGVYGGGTGNTKDNPASASMRYATYDEAEAYGCDLLCRWTQPSDFIVIQSDDAVNAAYEGGQIIHLGGE